MGNDISEEDDRGPLGVDVVIDEDYRKPLGVTLFNHRTDAPFQIKEGNQIALLVCESIVSPPLIKDNNLDKNVFIRDQNSTDSHLNSVIVEKWILEFNNKFEMKALFTVMFFIYLYFMHK